VLWLLRRAVVSAFDDGCFSTAKSAAYSALLSIFPVLTSAATILVQTRAEFVSRTLQHAIARIVPPGSEELIVTKFQVSGERPWGVLVVAGVVAIWAASGVIKSLIDGFHAAYRVPRDRGFLRQQTVAMALVLACIVPLLAASVLILFGGLLERAIVNWMNVDPILSAWSGAWKWVSLVTRYIVAFTTTAVVAAVLYYFGPYREQRWRYVWPGAILTTFLWMLAISGFGWYASNIAKYNVMYGSIGAGIALLVWMYLMAFIALIGCEFNAEFERSAVARERALK
jgi:membrane protein